MKIGIATVLSDKRGYEAELTALRQYGYDGIDLGCFCNTKTELFALDLQGFEAYLKKLGQFACAQGLEIYQTHGPWRYPPQDATDADRAERFEKMDRSLYGTAVLGASCMVIHPLMPYGTKVNVNPDGVFAINVEYFQRLARRAGEYGVTLCLENMPMKVYPFSRTQSILDIVKAVDSPHFRVCLDTGHAAIFGDVAEDVRNIGKEYLRAIHVHDNDGEMDRHWLPYAGVIHWENFCLALGEIGYEGYLSLESELSGQYPPELEKYHQLGVVKTARYLADLVEKAKAN